MQIGGVVGFDIRDVEQLPVKKVDVKRKQESPSEKEES